MTTGTSPALERGDFFVCDFFDASPKHDLASLEHPLFSLATRPDRRILHYTHNDVAVTVTPSVRGRATIFDADILIFCISQLMAALNAGRVCGHLAGGDHQELPGLRGSAIADVPEPIVV